MSVSAGCCSGTVTSGLCPGSSDIMCCTNNQCSTPLGSGTCMQTSACSGMSLAGYCTGPSDVQCCVSQPSGMFGVDISSSISESIFECLTNSGFGSFVIPRGYCSTGEVDSKVCTTLINAQSAGYSNRDVYMFPCPVVLILLILLMCRDI